MNKQKITIVKNRDEKGNILTYSVKGLLTKNPEYEMEFNTMKEVKIMMEM